ncbi:hypothetical protein Ctha_2107 [Chloroherpeton thalassium ATCC 35110]|uniref:Uncharacterized protein n=1 Tax=Chloroherpeton thalassium (strain ATCC 35110 / GB-78) TaxID=517418 RepID=B3QVF9_CHLT3|nr:NusG domain II-containing protein [Chloroherpeton thalassium]ACF14559.1 hypothetical protein Ctha_2107 [Chloroherpeton thalassium ATCC 35110]
MDRRIFLKRSMQMLVALPFTGMATGLLSAVEHAPAESGFSLSILTGSPEQALDMAQSLIQRHFGTAGQVQYSEFAVAGENIGEIALVKNSRLVNYKLQGDALSRDLARMARKLDVLTKVKNPTCLQFTSGAPSSQPEKVRVFRQNTLIEEVSFSAKEDKIFTVEGLKGAMSVQIKNGAVSVAETSCRHKTCVQMGTVKEAGRSLVCIPNQITVALSGSGKNDAIVF